ncbi:hypothetical protein [Luedemannella helvata]|uniref:Alanine and proline-rich secreted protein Apa n=1 Tax=Luedemannella helvata TaxID=349315 RepID=A0ABP4X9J0_9ACTN
MPAENQPSSFPSGAVTGRPDAAWWPTAAAPPPSRPSRRALFWYGGAAAAIVATGLVVILVLALNGGLGDGRGLLSSTPDAPPDVRPTLARLCPPPTGGEASPAPSSPPAPKGPRTVDERAGISYRAYGAPWRPWPYLWRMGTLEVPYGSGQFFVTESYLKGDYLASLLSAAVPATVNDSFAVDLACTGRQVAADVRAEYYPQPNRLEPLREASTTLGGRPAWVTKFRVHFDEPTLRARSELVAVALIDVGRPTAAVLYVSVPDTVPDWEWIVDDVLTTVRPL